jgi:hypothetical protein
MQASQDGQTLRVLETARGVLVRMPLDSEGSLGFRILTRGDTLLISGDGHVESIKLPRPAAQGRRLTAWQESGVLLVHVPLGRELQPSFSARWTESDDRRVASPTQSVNQAAKDRAKLH